MKATKPLSSAGGRQLFDLNDAAGAGKRPAVGQKLAGASEQAGANACRLHQPANHLQGALEQKLRFAGAVGRHRAFAERTGHDLALVPQGQQLRIQEARLVFVEIEQAGDQKGQRQHVDREHPPGEG